ncbi:MAG: hypothetical protein WBC07_08595 [Methylotenera sp.]
MIAFLCVVIGLYILVDSLYLASIADGENRMCTLSKYAGSLMASLYLIFDKADEVRLLLGIVLALFMWPDTYYRLLDWLQQLSPPLYRQFLMRFDIKPRRRTDR